jgi:hypothetical protein
MGRGAGGLTGYRPGDRLEPQGERRGKMKSLGIRGRRWLKAFHVLFSMTWIGAGITQTIIPFVTGNITSDAELYAYNKAIELGDLIVIPCAILCVITGLLLCWQTPWGFFKYWSVVIPLVVWPVAIALGISLGSWTSDLVRISKAEGLAALQNGGYLYALQMYKILSIVWIIILIFGAFVSVIKPWGRIGKIKGEAEPSPIGTT